MYDKDSPFLPGAPVAQKSDLALDELTEAILGCALPPDAVVTEAELAGRFGHPLAATRTALSRLAAQGWVRAELRRGWRVLPVTGRHLSDLLLARRTLEPALTGVTAPGAVLHEIGIQARLYRSLWEVSDPVPDPGADARRLRHELRLRVLIAGLLPQPRMRAWLVETWQMSARADLYLAATLGLRLTPAPLDRAAAALAEGRPADFADALAVATEAFADRCRRAAAHSDAAIGPPQIAAPASAADAAPRPARPDRPGRTGKPARTGQNRPTNGETT